MESNFRFIQKGNPIESVCTRGTTVSLLASSKSTEVIHHCLKKGFAWMLYPEDGWDELEYLYIISGTLLAQIGEEKVLLLQGDSFSAFPVSRHLVFTAQTDVEFLYVVSKPVFHNYSQRIKEFWELAVEIEKKDGSTSDHCERIRSMSIELGQYLELSSDQLSTLSFGAFLHDLGKLNVPDSILQKPGKLTPEEFEVMKKHALYGKEMLVETGLPYFYSASVVLEQHHERYNGSGYPYGLKGDEIDILASIVAVVDSYDAIRSRRVYKEAQSREGAIEEIKRNRGILYHPKVVDGFMHIIDKFD